MHTNPTSIAIPSLIILFIIVSNPCIPLSFCYTYYRKLLYFCVFHNLTKHHIQMFQTAKDVYKRQGICFVLLGLINKKYTWDIPLLIQMLIGTFIITLMEFIFGCIFNLLLNLNVWDCLLYTSHFLIRV